MQTDMNKMFESTHKELEREVDQSKALVKQSAQELTKLKSHIQITEDLEPIEEDDGWDIEYEEE